MSDKNTKKTKTKNDIAWEALFEKYSILEKINEIGYFEIESNSINEFRESRLMAKFDHSGTLPKIFKEHKLSILPISRKKYIIGRFDTYLKVDYDPSLEPTPVDFPSSIESIDYCNLFSESAALSCAFNIDIIDDLINSDGEIFKQTVYGRMSTGKFNFFIKDRVDNKQYQIEVDNSQCEIDAGFESENYFVLVEAKLYDVDNFLIRQLYYPYQLWSNKIRTKQVIPVLMTYSNSSNIFSFFIYKFENLLDYNSIRLVEQKNYVIAPEIITHDDVSEIFKSITIAPEPKNIPFPQANTFARIIDLLTILLNKELTKEEITANYQFNQRQTNYYTNAARYLGFVEKSEDRNTKEINFKLTDETTDYLKKRHKIKILYFIRKILQYEVFYKTFESTLSNGEIPDKNELIKIILSCNSNLSNTTADRRSSTVRRWIEWILSMISDE